MSAASLLLDLLLVMGLGWVLHQRGPRSPDHEPWTLGLLLVALASETVVRGSFELGQVGVAPPDAWTAVRGVSVAVVASRTVWLRTTSVRGTWLRLFTLWAVLMFLWLLWSEGGGEHSVRASYQCLGACFFGGLLAARVVTDQWRGRAGAAQR